MNEITKNHNLMSEKLKSIAKAKKLGQALLANSLQAVMAKYDSNKKMVVVHLNNGASFSFPPYLAQGLTDAKASELKVIELSPQGTGLYWPRLDADLSVTGLLSGVFGSLHWTREQAAKAGRARSEAKAIAARANGAKGGRPRTSSDKAAIVNSECFNRREGIQTPNMTS